VAEVPVKPSVDDLRATGELNRSVHLGVASELDRSGHRKACEECSQEELEESVEGRHVVVS
jgi:hypothetical protein